MTVPEVAGGLRRTASTGARGSDALPLETARDLIMRQSIDGLLRPVGQFLADPDVSEVMINGPDEVWIERSGRISRTEARFASEADLAAAARGIAQFSGKRLTPEELSVEARLPDGSRVHIVQAPAARETSLAIRRFRKVDTGLPELVALGSFTEDAAEFLASVVYEHRNVLVSGGTGTGKTTLVNALARCIGPEERIVVIEDTAELQIGRPHVLYFEARWPDRYNRGGITVRELFLASLRMRPDRIIVGECRGAEAIDMIQAMTSGHSGGLSTLHATSPLDALGRLETMAMLGGLSVPLPALRRYIASAMDVIVQVVRVDGRRMVQDIAEVQGIADEGTYSLRKLYTRQPIGRGPLERA
jgi:pilus assembly protein CpaF